MAASRKKSDDRTRGVQFTKASAAAIAETVRIVQGGDRKQPGLRGGSSSYPSSHYLAKTTATWTSGTSATLTIYAGDAGSEADSGQTVQAWNRIATIPSGIWVVIARANATFYLVSFDMTGLSGYAAGSQQILSHSTGGVLSWVSTTTCT